MTLEQLVAAELAEPVDPRVTAMATAIAARHPGARAVLFYGSCLRDATLSGMLDFYLIVSDYRAAFDNAWLALANRWLPPNVFPFAHDSLTAKYAVLSEADFARLCGGEGPSALPVVARFAQPSRLVWQADEAARSAATAAVAEAAPALLDRVRALFVAEDALATWRAAFGLTYQTELRAERGERPGAIVDADPARYERIYASAPRAAGWTPRRAEAYWRRARLAGKALHALRLLKASLTFAGGIDYLAWKINRHAGTQIVLTPWQRRHPLLAAVTLLPRLLRAGAVR